MLSNRILHRFPHVRLRALSPTTVALPQSLSFSTPSTNNLFANSTNVYHVEEMYWYWKQDPKPVHPSWDIYFSGLEKGLPSSVAFQRPPSVMPVPLDGVPALHASSGAELDHHLKTQLLARAYQVCDHHVAQLDPLDILDPDLDSARPPELEPSCYGFTEHDLEKGIVLWPRILLHLATEGKKTMKSRQIIKLCQRIYRGAVGIQYVHIPDKEQCDGIRERVEIPKPWDCTIDEKRMILDRLIWSESFKKFIASKYPNEK